MNFVSIRLTKAFISFFRFSMNERAQRIDKIGFANHEYSEYQLKCIYPFKRLPANNISKVKSMAGFFLTFPLHSHINGVAVAVTYVTLTGMQIIPIPTGCLHMYSMLS